MLAPIAHQKQMIGQVTLTPQSFGQGQSILKRALAKIYHREASVHVMQEMFEHPGTVVPVLLLRFKSKLEEWKASHVSKAKQNIHQPTDNPSVNGRKSGGMLRKSSFGEV